MCLGGKTHIILTFQGDQIFFTGINQFLLTGCCIFNPKNYNFQTMCFSVASNDVSSFQFYPFVFASGGWDIEFNRHWCIKEFGYCSKERINNPQFEMCGCSGYLIFSSSILFSWYPLQVFLKKVFFFNVWNLMVC